MDCGIVTAKVDEIGYITHAENLGYTHCWVTDSQMIRSNCWAVLALAAQQTHTMRLGTGVNVPGLRLAPVTANGIATINRLAPGRCFISLGTGHTAMRMLGQRPMPLKPFREYIRVVRALLNGEEVDYTLNGATHRIRFQMREHHFIDLDHPIKLYVAAFGPKAQALAGELGDGLVSGLPRGGTVPSMLANARAGAAAWAVLSEQISRFRRWSPWCCCTREKRSPPNASSPKAARPLSPGCIIWSPAIWKPVKIRQSMPGPSGTATWPGSMRRLRSAAPAFAQQPLQFR